MVTWARVGRIVAPAVMVTALAGLAACSNDGGTDVSSVQGGDEGGDAGSEVTGATERAGSAPSATDPIEPAGVAPEGFSTVAAIVTDATGEQCELCLWLADTPDERGRGLMGVTDLGGADGMVFRFDGPSSGAFYMFQTPTPLSIAWFAPDGAYVGEADMDPCLDTPAGECARYSPGEEYDLAVEVFAGGLPSLGIGPGAHIELVAGSEADRCPLASGVTPGDS